MDKEILICSKCGVLCDYEQGDKCPVCGSLDSKKEEMVIISHGFIGG